MKKIITILTSFTLTSATCLNSNIVENSQKIINNFKNIFSSDIKPDFSYFRNEINREDNKDKPNWDNNNIENNNLNINFPDFENSIGDDIRTNTYLAIFKSIDTKYYSQERKCLPSDNYFISIATKDIDNIFTNLYITVMNESNNSSQSIGDNSNTFDNFKVPTNDIKSFNLRISNNGSTDWNNNDSYFDVSINICDFNFSGNKIPVWNWYLHNRPTDTKGNRVAIDKDTSNLNFQTEDDCGSSSDPHWQYINVNLPYSDISYEIKNINTLLFFTQPNDPFTFQSEFKIEEQTMDHGDKTQYSRFNNIAREIDLKDSDSDNLNIYNINKLNSLDTNQTATGNNGDGVVSTEGGSGSDGAETNFYRNTMHARGYENLYYGDDELLLHSKGLTKTDKRDYAGRTYRFNFFYGEVEFDIHWNNMIFNNRPK